MAVGPVDVYIIGFPGNKFTGRIAPAILELVENGTIRVLDLLFVMKDADGAVTTLQAADIDEEGAAFLSIDIAQPGALGPEDAEEVSDDLPANSAAILVAFENLWAAKLVEALQAADAVVDRFRPDPGRRRPGRARHRLDPVHFEIRKERHGTLRMATRTAVVAGTATAVSGRVARRQAAKWDKSRMRSSTRSSSRAPPPAPAEDDQTAKLQNLAKLHAQGVLTDEEFAAAKAKILGI